VVAVNACDESGAIVTLVDESIENVRRVDDRWIGLLIRALLARVGTCLAASANLFFATHPF
jgi:hypothetical protein